MSGLFGLTSPCAYSVKMDELNYGKAQGPGFKMMFFKTGGDVQALVRVFVYLLIVPPNGRAVLEVVGYLISFRF